jgi:adenine-specific DNA-methyltransferase
MTGNSSGERGAIFTKKEVVDFMLDEVGYVSTQNLSDIRVLEPSSGEGAFAIEIIHRLYESSTRFSFDFGKALKNLYFVEIDEKALSVLKIRLRSYLKENMDLFKKINFLLDDFLLTKMPSNFDLIIGNPPYIRWDKISREKKSQYFNLFKTFRGRADIYIPFFEKSLSLLTHGGVLSFICSNRWFKSAYGKYLRRLVVSNYRLEKIIDLEQVNPFTSKVTAYPAITTIKNNFDANHLFYEYHELDNIESLCQDIKYKNIRYEPYSGKVWRQDDSIDFRNRRIFKKIEDQGFKIKIGVATGKDAVFIGSDLDDKVENELLIPLVKSSHLRNNEFTESDLKIINVFEKGWNPD